MISASMWTFLVLAPLLLLIGKRTSRSQLDHSAAVTIRRTLVSKLWPIFCAALAAAVLVLHLVLPHPSGADFEGVRALRFFTVWCHAAVTAYFTFAAVLLACRSAQSSREEAALFYTVAPPSLLTAVVFWFAIYPANPPSLQSHAFRFDEYTMHALNVPMLLVDSLLLAHEAHAAQTAGLWLYPVAFTASYLPFHSVWLALGGRPIYAFLNPSLPWAGAIHAALLGLVLACFHAFRLLALARSRCDTTSGQGPPDAGLIAAQGMQIIGSAISKASEVGASDCRARL